MNDFRKYTIEQKLTAIAKDTVIAKRELRKLLEVGHNRFNDILKATIGDKKNASAEQLGIIAKYLKCSVQSLYTEQYFKSLPTIKSIEKAEVNAAA